MNRSYACDMAERYPESDVLVGAAESVWNGSDARINISIDVSSKLVNHMSDYLSEALLSVFITDSDIRHIKRKHGSDEERRGQITIVPDDFSCIPQVLNEFDSCEHTDTDKLGNKKFLLKKNIGGTVYLVTVQRGKRKLEIKTMWKENRSGASC
ncbi:hypothetical protein [Adlercreutzia caecimuris]|jgi:hypothetical protein|uniref:PBECR3 domain-containing polyvalent protein n=2 Tax=Adlercreutzia caecimuris TaxID=671266 RepID=UPI00214B9CAA|nr:hypothetical protein [Adlercreutzia caecimuris]